MAVHFPSIDVGDHENRHALEALGSGRPEFPLPAAGTDGDLEIDCHHCQATRSRIPSISNSANGITPPTRVSQTMFHQQISVVNFNHYLFFPFLIQSTFLFHM